jgi:hypothetical protein
MEKHKNREDPGNGDGGAEDDEDILHYYPLAKTQQKRAKWPSCSRTVTV